MLGDLHFYLNSTWVDAYQSWGISFEDKALSALLSPPPMKEYISNASRDAHGIRLMSSDGVPRVAERELSLPFHLVARDKADFFTKYRAFCQDVLLQGRLYIKLPRIDPDTVYKCFYLSCTEFQEFQLGLAKFVLQVLEPNPMNRSM